MGSGWNFGDVWEAIANDGPDEPMYMHNRTVRAWGEFEVRTSSIAAAIADTGIDRQAKVALYMYNCPEYAETFAAAVKGGFVPVNTNYRYLDDELVYIWTRSDTRVVVYDSRFDERISEVRSRVPAVILWLRVGDAGGSCPEWATPYEQVATSGDSLVSLWRRSGDDLFLVFTGGTTGFPKAVMWTQHDFTMAMLATVFGTGDFPEQPSMRRLVPPAQPRPVGSAVCPFMHGTGLSMLILTMLQGGTVVSSTPSSFRASDFLDLIQVARVTQIAIVGDVFARPIREAIDAEPKKWDLSSLKLIFSAGAMLSRDVRDGLFSHLPKVTIADTYGSSESVGVASMVVSAGESAPTARFRLSPHARVVDENDCDVVPGSGVTGRLAVSGHQPLGYYKDPEATARVFRLIDNVRYSIAGDMALVERDGTITVLGRGVTCINTGGEKVFPEEVEEILKTHPAVYDAAVVGVPDQRFGECVIALVQPSGRGAPDREVLINHVKTLIAGYKAPKHIVVVEDLGRSVAGKLDYPKLRERAVDALAINSEEE
jgi:3-oxocholest-4-en-26-oate---CoA ligase